jgi:hypothetical protein
MDELPVTVPHEVARIGKEDAPRLDQELYRHREQPPAYGFDPQDGLPRVVPESSYEETYVPPLDPTTFICMADTTEFRLLSGATILARFTADEVQRQSDGRYYVSYELALSRTERSLHHHVLMHVGSALTPVEPIRRACKHYVRQMIDLAGHRDRRVVTRFCTALRDENGEFQSLRDGLVYACELRDPREPVSEGQLDDFDRRKITEGRERRENDEGEFDVDAELRIIHGQKIPIVGQLLGYWFQDDAWPDKPPRYPPVTALLLSKTGDEALTLVNVEDTWCVLSASAAATYSHSRRWFTGNYRHGWDADLGADWKPVSSTESFLTTDPDVNWRDALYSDPEQFHPEHWRQFEVVAIKAIEHQDIAARFGDAAAAAARSDQQSILLRVAERAAEGSIP